MNYKYYCAPYDPIAHGYRCFKIDQNNPNLFDFELGFIDQFHYYHSILNPNEQIIVNLDSTYYFNHWPNNIIQLAISLTLIHEFNTNQLDLNTILELINF